METKLKKTIPIIISSFIIYLLLAGLVYGYPSKYNVTFISEPSNATVIIDGKSIGYTPLINYLLSEGEHEVEIVYLNYEPFSKTYNITRDYEEKDIKLTKIFNVIFYSKPSNAEVYVSGVSKGKTPLNISLSEGKHDVEIAYPNYERFSKTYDIINNETYSVNLKELVFTWELVFYIISINIIIVGILYLYYRNKNNSLISEITALKKDMSSQGTKISTLKDRLERYEGTNLKEVSDKFKSTEKDYLVLKSEYDSLNGEKWQLKSDLKVKEEELENRKKELALEKSNVRELTKEKENLIREKIEFKNALDKYKEFFDLDSLPIDIKRGISTDSKRLYDDFYKEKEVLREVYALDEVLTPLFNTMKDVSANADIKAIKNYPVYSPKQVFEILKSIDMKLEKNPAFMQCLKAIKFRLR